MESFAVLATRYAKSSLPRVAHSALPDAPTQPFHPRRGRRALLGNRTRRGRPGDSA
jgi:hypothetical protein